LLPSPRAKPDDLANRKMRASIRRSLCRRAHGHHFGASANRQEFPGASILDVVANV
jgi:hypothetical protein